MMPIQSTLIILCCTLLFAFPATATDIEAEGMQLLEKSKAYHGKTSLENILLQIQEPRIANPSRYSRVQFRADGGLSLTRNRGVHTSTHIVTGAGEVKTLFNGSEILPDDARKKYRLDAQRTRMYAFIYSFMYNLPLSLNQSNIKEITAIEKAVKFDDKDAVKISFLLNKAVFSDKWSLYLDPVNYRMLGIDIDREQQPELNERIIFARDKIISGMRVPYLRHWYRLATDEYRGSDIIITATKLEER